MGQNGGTATLLEKTGNYDEAERLQREALAMVRNLLGNAHPVVATSLNNLARVRQKKRDYKDAVRRYREAITINLEALGRDHTSGALSLSNLGECSAEPDVSVRPPRLSSRAGRKAG